MHKDNVLDLEKPKTIIFFHFWAFLGQNLILKKKIPKHPQWPLKGEKNCVFEPEIIKNFKILELSYMVQNGIKMVFGRKRSREKRFLFISWHFWSKKKFWKKKSKNTYKSWKITIFYPQRDLKIQILVLSNMAKKYMKRVFGNKKSP